MDRDTALRKVLACLRLSKSSNPNEAAMALRQAQALMREYGLTEDEAHAHTIREALAEATCRGLTPPKSIAWLINMIARGYGCQAVLDAAHGRSARIRFFGYGADAQVAAYAFTVLFRQLNAARLKHISRVRKRANRERRGEEFAIGWMVAVSAMFPTEALPDDRARAIERAIDTALPGTQNAQGRDLTKRGRAHYGDRSAGYTVGKQATLHQGLNGNAQRQLGRDE